MERFVVIEVGILINVVLKVYYVLCMSLRSLCLLIFFMFIIIFSCCYDFYFIIEIREVKLFIYGV